MIDTINYRLSDYRSDTDFREQVPYLLENVCESKRSNETFYTGYLGNLKINVNKNSLKVANSLCKWYLGDNLQTLNLESIKLANEKLSDTLHVNMQSAVVSRLDIGHNFSMNHKPKIYFDLLGQLSRYNRLEQPNGICYRTKNLELIFYDKLIEQKVKGGEIPINYNNSNLLRYEIKMLRNVKSILKCSELNVDMLSKPAVYIQMIQIYKDIFSKINIIKELNLSFAEIKGVKGLKDIALAHYISVFGVEVLLKQIKNDFVKDKISEKEKRGMLNTIKRLSVTPDYIIESECSKELLGMIQNYSPDI